MLRTATLDVRVVEARPWVDDEPRARLLGAERVPWLVHLVTWPNPQCLRFAHPSPSLDIGLVGRFCASADRSASVCDHELEDDEREAEHEVGRDDPDRPQHAEPLDPRDHDALD